jgi:hypothetical protein
LSEKLDKMTLQQPSAMSITQLCNVDEPIEQKEQEEQGIICFVCATLLSYENSNKIIF